MCHGIVETFLKFAEMAASGKARAAKGVKKAPRQYDAGKADFGKAHAVKGAKQVVRHIVANDHLKRNGCDKKVYAKVAHKNYKMGSVKQNNSMDKLVDNGVTGAVFGGSKAHKGGYNAEHVARGGVPFGKQKKMLKERNATARGMYVASKDHVTFKVLAHDYHVAAQSVAMADMRESSSKK